ncbi:ORF060 [Staphylococcus phage 187]|uniref:ORF060 n=1 Tax=Staphylococcus phage 187 TaxID=2908096 RepID=Q4ZDY8_9CAUD|nr:ORF060 [Staphylococcus phage 187]AAX90727.1 ORF060 [Staphylococcus phage 187]
MYYEIGDVCQKVINVDGFDFKLAVKKQDYSILVNVLDLEDRFIDGINITDENDLYTALDILNQSIYEWIEENTDEQDRLINLVMKW